MTDRLSPLDAQHRALGASFTDFAGWQMPVRYSSELDEHHAVRTAAGLFDISHMAEFRIAGPQAAAFLDAALCMHASALAPARARYTLLLADDGGVLDDLIVYHDVPGEFLVVANAGNRAVVAAQLSARAHGFDASVTDLTEAIALIAVQGPAARSVIEATPGLSLGADPALAALPYYACLAGEFEGGPLLVARTGYTGEDGVELYLDTGRAPQLWDALLASGADHGLVPCGLAARDTLRLEAGMPLYGHELTREVQPAQAGLARVALPPGKAADFVGRAAVERGPAAGARVLVGLAAEGRRAARAGYEVRHGDETVGVVTSGALSPTLGHPIAFAFLDPQHSEPGTTLELDVRGSRLAATVVPTPFYRRSAS